MNYLGLFKVARCTFEIIEDTILDVINVFYSFKIKCKLKTKREYPCEKD